MKRVVGGAGGRDPTIPPGWVGYIYSIPTRYDPPAPRVDHGAELKVDVRTHPHWPAEVHSDTLPGSERGYPMGESHSCSSGFNSC